MNLFVADSELKRLSSETTEAIDGLVGLGNQFSSRLEKLKDMGYVSEGMEAVMTERIALVRSAVAQLSQTAGPLDKTVSSFISGIDDIDFL